MKRFVTLTTIITVSIIYTSCKKESHRSESNCEITMANINGAYKITDAKYKTNSGAAEINYLDEFFDNQDCEKDDILTFGADGILTTTDAGTQCTPPTTGSETWELSGNKIIVETEEAVIESIDCQAKVMILKYTDWNADGDELRIFLRKQ